MPVTLAQVSKELIETWAEIAQNVLAHCQRTGKWELLRGDAMPAKSKSQQRFFGAELARKRAGKETQTGVNYSP